MKTEASKRVLKNKTYPYVGQYVNNIDLLVYFIKPNCGVTLSIKDKRCAEDWLEENFTIYDGIVTLSND